MNKLSPIVSEFETEEEAEAHDRWFRAKVEAALADERPGIPHDEAMARIRRKLEKLASKAADPHLARIRAG
jgi:hypothetical protein